MGDILLELDRQRRRKQSAVEKQFDDQCKQLLDQLRAAKGPTKFAAGVARDWQPQAEQTGPRAQMDAERRIAGAALHCRDCGYIEIVGERPDAERFDFGPDDELVLTDRGRRQRGRVRKPSRAPTKLTLVARTNREQQVVVEINGTSVKLPRQLGLLLRVLHTKTDKTAAREDLVDRTGKPPSHDNMRQLGSRLRRALKTITTDRAEIDAAIQVNARGASVTLDTQFLHVIWKDDDPPRERNVVTGFDESYEAGDFG